MRAVLIFTAALFTLSVAACNAQPPSARDVGEGGPESPTPPPGGVPNGAPQRGGVKQASATGIQPLEQKKFGQPITESTTTPLPAIVKDVSQFSNKTIRTEGMVSAVCQSMGCWMQIADTSGKAHIKMAGHSFFVPKQSSGHRAVVQGKVMGANQPNACGGDGCGNQEVTQVEIEATGIEFLD